MSVLKHIIDYLLKICGIAALLLGLYLGLLTIYADRLILPAIASVLTGLLVLQLNRLIKKYDKARCTLWQCCILITGGFAGLIYYLYTTASTTIVVTNPHSTEAIIIFNIKDRPSLPYSIFGRRKIILPENNILMTSDGPESLSYGITVVHKGDTLTKTLHHIYQHCIINNQHLSALYIPIENCRCDYSEMPENNSDIQKYAQIVYNRLSTGELQVNGVREQFKMPLFTDNRGPYLDMQYFYVSWKGPLPDSISRLKIYKADLKSHPLNRIPEPLLMNPYIEELYLKNCNLGKIPSSIANMKQLKILDIRNNYINTLPQALLSLPRLKTIYMGANQIPRDSVSKWEKRYPGIQFNTTTE